MYLLIIYQVKKITDVVDNQVVKTEFDVTNDVLKYDQNVNVIIKDNNIYIREFIYKPLIITIDLMHLFFIDYFIMDLNHDNRGMINVNHQSVNCIHYNDHVQIQIYVTNQNYILPHDVIVDKNAMNRNNHLHQSFITYNNHTKIHSITKIISEYSTNKV